VGIRPVEGLSATVGLYSQAIPVPAGSTLLFVSGQLSVDPEGNVVGENDFPTQYRTVFENLMSVVRGSGGGPEDLVKMTTYLVDAKHVTAFYEAREGLYSDLFPTGVYPGNTLLVVQRLVRPEFLIEIEAVAAIPERSSN